MKIVVANTNPIHRPVEKECEEAFNASIIREKHQLSRDALDAIEPDFIFFLHWSHIIPENIYTKYVCIVFHMTDLPYGRGGSPLQNLIIRGHQETVISALQVEKGIDTGPVFLKKKLSLAGTAEEIFLRAGPIMFEMMREIIHSGLKPAPQEGEALTFKRRTPDESNVATVQDVEKLYDIIRMLDAEGYPKAFIETPFFKFEFTRASLKTDGIRADVKITKK